MDNTYSISEVADKLQLSTKTLRRWEETGKFTGIRTLGNQRRYSVTDIHILDAIKHGIIESSADLLTLEQAASMCSVTPATFARWEEEGKIHPLITANMIYYPRQRILQKLASLRPTPPTPVAFTSVPIPPSPQPSPIQHQQMTPLVQTEQVPTKTEAMRSSLYSVSPTLPTLVANVCITLILLLGYHFLIAPASVPSSPQGSVQGVETDRDQSLNLLDTIMDPSGALRPSSVTTPTLSFKPIVTPTKAVPGTLYFDAGSGTLKIYRAGGWSDLNSPVSITGSTIVSSGRSQIQKDEQTVVVQDNTLTRDSIVSVTFTGDYSPAKKHWVTVRDGSFTLSTDFPLTTATTFTYQALTSRAPQPSPSPIPTEEPSSAI